MTFDPETATFLIAGPGPGPDPSSQVLRAMSMSSLNHRGDYFHHITSRTSGTFCRSCSGRRATLAVVLTGSGTARAGGGVLTSLGVRKG